MITKLRIGWLAVAVGLGATAETAAAQSCPTCTASGGIREKIGSVCWSRLSPRALIQSRCAPNPPTICPGSCFGYIKPQWTAWNQACPNWGGNCVEPPIGGVAQAVPVAVPAAVPLVPTNAIPPATNGSVPTPKPNDVAPPPAKEPAAAPATEPAPPPKPVPSSKTFVPIPVLPPQPINTRLPLPPTPDLPRS